jgi:hypothetical protein
VEIKDPEAFLRQMTRGTMGVRDTTNSKKSAKSDRHTDVHQQEFNAY